MADKTSEMATSLTAVVLLQRNRRSGDLIEEKRYRMTRLAQA
jgi:hypothetical protein